MPRPASRPSRRAIAGSGPATTVRAGPLTAATETSGVSRGSSSASGRGTVSIAPGSIAAIRRPRSATTSRASSSEKTPAIQARDVLADGMADHRRRADPPGHPLPGQGVLDDEQRRLGELGALQAPRRLPGLPLGREERGPQILPEDRPQDLAGAVHLVAEDGLGAVEVRSHPGMLRALAAEQEGHGACIAGAEQEAVGIGSVEDLDGVGSISGAAAEGHGAVAEPPPADLQRIGGVGDPGLGMPLEMLAETVDRAGQRRLAARREREQLPRTAGGSGGERRRLLEHDMGIGAADAERAHAGAPGGRGVFPLGQPGGDAERALLQLQLRIGLLEVEARRHLPVLEHQAGLDQARHAGRGVEMPDVGLGRADEATTAGHLRSVRPG